jgi:predicted GH43/DUF377 family glycosyl hydrolase
MPLHATSLHVKRTNVILYPDQTRVLLRPFVPGSEQRADGIIARIMALPEERVGPLLAEVCAEFARRHLDIRKLFLERFEEVAGSRLNDETLTEQRRLLIGSYFLAEYALESAALFNPSIVPDPDQSDLPPGALHFVLSLRATGEGHVSSITFRSGVVYGDGRIELVPPKGLLTEPRQIPNQQYEKALFRRKLSELGLEGEFTGHIMETLRDSFTLEELRASLRAENSLESERAEIRAAAQGVLNLARSNYEVQFQPEENLSERIIFPATPSQQNGIEDARFVRFRNEDGSYIYYATFTAYDGKIIVPELLETSDFLLFRFITLNGPAARNKGMALFPRKVGGRFAMLGRQDNESISLMFSDNVHFWHEHTVLLEPAFPWELVQIGNCGSPIETDAGWLVLSHGVGPLRKYSIGAFLLDLDNPAKIIGRLREPLLKPNENEREGYVPNVVYTCGALLHNGELIIPYGMADHATGFATVPLADLLAAMTD